MQPLFKGSRAGEAQNRILVRRVVSIILQVIMTTVAHTVTL